MMSLDDDAHEDLSFQSNRPTSIDLTLELEHQLERDEPFSPQKESERPRSLDTNVLASIVTQLRMSLDEVTKERDELKAALAAVAAREADMQESLNTVTTKCANLETELQSAKEKHQEDEDAITMLRSKVEESRRALMRLQTESRRMSQVSNLTLDLNNPSSRRTSFTPLTGSPAGRLGHRRISSVSDSAYVLSAPSFGGDSQWPTSPPPEGQSTRSTSGHSKRMSGIWGLGSGPAPVRERSPSPDPSVIEVLTKELETVKVQLEETRHELSEAQEAKEASEMCVRALRTFISENSIGVQPTVATARPSLSQEDDVKKTTASPGRWGFKLWSTDSTTTTAPTPVSSPVVGPNANSAAPVAGAPLSRKLGGLFGGRGSFSSTTSSLRPSGTMVHQEPMCNGSDTSSLADSMAEPISPASEQPRRSIAVQEVGQGPSLEQASEQMAVKGIDDQMRPG
ncbi:hypothetical protein CERSUDRAFT_112727 [Gelatoporia subvermispora B]|uniref:Uncharacterized protein n=1 Tax=Ceriporiopsis subvermispora (strain B) TaxID=914234 RepID=M2R3E9_CERS8|nr:hypothetical protein CERSUDRAFT_112727 [Gelatoporia subvermispora B]